MKALILSAGYGTRLGELTRERPKPMLEVGGVPLIEHIVRHLHAHRLSDIAINLHHRPQAIVNHLGDGARLGVRIRYTYEDRLLGTAGTVRRWSEDGWTEPLLVHYGDVLTDHDLTAMIGQHARRQAAATCLVHRRFGSNSAAYLGSNDRIERFVERPASWPGPDHAGHLWVYSGVCILSPACLAAMPERAPCDLPRDVFPKLARAGRLYGHRLAGYRCAVDSKQRLKQACQAVASGAYRPVERRN